MNPRLSERLHGRLMRLLERADASGAPVSPPQRSKVSYVDFEGTWDEAEQSTDGYSSDVILERVLAATMNVVNGNSVHERDSVNFDHIEYSWPVLAGLMWSATRNLGHLRVLDFGGALGSAFLQNRKFLSSLESKSWAIVEQHNFVESGRRHLERGELTFHDSIAAASKTNPSVILASSVLQYLRDPRAIISELSTTPADTLIIDRTPTHAGEADHLTIQHVPEKIYPASYPCWILSHRFLTDTLAAEGWQLVEEFSTLEQKMRTPAGIDVQWRGMLMTRPREL